MFIQGIPRPHDMPGKVFVFQIREYFLHDVMDTDRLIF